MATDYTEKITGIEEQIAQLRNRQRELLQKSKVQERKARTKRLIERGAILENLVDNSGAMTNVQLQTLLEKALCGQSHATRSTESNQSEAVRGGSESAGKGAESG